MRTEGQRRQVLPVPQFGRGLGGWRERFGDEANLLAAEGPGNCNGGLLGWMLEQAKGLLAAGVLVGDLTAE